MIFKPEICLLQQTRPNYPNHKPNAMSPTATPSGATYTQQGSWGTSSYFPRTPRFPAQSVAALYGSFTQPSVSLSELLFAVKQASPRLHISYIYLYF